MSKFASPVVEDRPSPLPEDAAALSSVVALRSVRTVKAEGELFDNEVAQRISPEDSIVSATVRLVEADEGLLRFRVSHEDVLTDDQGRDAARVAVEFLVDFDLPDGFTPTPGQLSSFARTVLPRITHSHYRESVSSMLSRIGIQGLTVGLVQGGANLPPSSNQSGN